MDFTQLSKAVRREIHPLPVVEHTLAQLHGAVVMSKLDGNSGFWQIPLSPASSALTTFLSPFGRFRFLRLPFGICSAPEHYQRRMMTVLQGLEGVVCQMDDVLVYGVDQKQHDARLRQVLQRLSDAGLTLNEKKCRFSVREVRFLGHIINARGIQVDPDKVAAINDMAPPKDVTELRRFLGMINFVSRFVPDLASRIQPLTGLLHHKSAWTWDDAQQTAFNWVKTVLSTQPVLAIYNPNAEVIVSADSSSYGLGAVLKHTDSDGSLRIVAYASRTLTDAETRYSQIEKEGLSLAWACDRFADYIVGRHFKLETDHKPLIPIFSSKSLDALSPRLQRFKIRLMRYDFSIFHTPGKDLHIADTLSRAPLQCKEVGAELAEEADAYVRMCMTNIPASPSKLDTIRREQSRDKTCQILKEYISSEWPQKRRRGY